MPLNERHSYLFTEDKVLCSGCRACEQVCSVHAIHIAEDKEGFLYPKIDTNRCIDCELCDTICPMNPQHKSTVQQDFIPRYYAVWPQRKDYKLTQQCATMGFSTMLAEYVLKSGGVVYGVWHDEEKDIAKHIRIDNLVEQYKMRNSKYMQSDIGATFSLAKKDLKNGLLVYFTGTPCQIAGLKAYLRKDYENLLTTDLICHGVFSYKICQAERKYWAEKYNGEILNLRFRGKGIFPYVIGGLINFNVKKGILKVHKNIPATLSPMYHAYAYAPSKEQYTLRLSCYNCQFRNMNRVGDITIGDFHGANKYHNLTFVMRQFGLSLIMCNTAKGQHFFEILSERINYFETTKEKCAVQPALLGEERKIPTQRQGIYANIDTMPYNEIVRQYICTDDYLNKRKIKILKYLLRYYLSALYHSIF